MGPSGRKGGGGDMKKMKKTKMKMKNEGDEREVRSRVRFLSINLISIQQPRQRTSADGWFLRHQGHPGTQVLPSKNRYYIRPPTPYYIIRYHTYLQVPHPLPFPFSSVQPRHQLPHKPQPRRHAQQIEFQSEIASPRLPIGVVALGTRG
jgi:hypothetical protein